MDTITNAVTAPPTCRRMIFVRGEDRRCGQSVGVRVWRDHTNQEHAACPNHIGGMMRRYPESVPDRVAGHGDLNLTTPWARGAFGPAERIEIENTIPAGFQVGVSGHPRRAIVWVIDPEGRELTRWLDQHDAIRAARVAVEFIRVLA